MGDTKKTEKLSESTIRKLQAANVLQRLCREVQRQAYRDMRLPADPAAKLIALNTLHNVFDRLDEAIERYVKGNTPR